jgi:BirA family transcriptional regulator, biotin operon repressor / biotin---[acetyl-CoA-carboxylase] ligase
VVFGETKKKLLLLLADGKFHSGTELSTELGLSRSAIWKHLHALMEQGIHVSAVNGKGYRFTKPIELFNQADIQQALSKDIQSLISSFEIHFQINSTNSYLVEKSRQGAATGVVCLAELQTDGKGRRGREWVSPFGSNIYLSILWRYDQGPATISGLSLAAGVAVIRALGQFKINDVGLKWPNDIYWQQQKLGGILVEVSGEAEGPCCVVLGIGLNVHLDQQEAGKIDQPWVDLQHITDQNPPSRNVLAAALINELLPVMAEYENKGFSHYLEEWRDYDCMRNKAVTLHMGYNQQEGIVQGIDDNGLLLLTRQDGVTQAFASGEVSFSATSL